MSRRQRSAREQAQRARVAREKSLRRRARTRHAAGAAAAAVTLAGTAAAAPTGAQAASEDRSRELLLHCGDASTPSSSPSNLTDVEGQLFFTAYDPIHGTAMWRTTGNGGTVLIKRLGTDDGGYYDDYDDTNTVAMGGRLFFTIETDDAHELWRSNGTPTGTVRIKRLPSRGDDDYDDDYDGSNGFSNLTAVGDTLFFTADDGTHGEELWHSDGTRAGTALLKDIGTGGSSGYYEYGPSGLTAVNDILYFTADDGSHGQELWKSDGTPAGTVMVEDIHPGSYSSEPESLTAVDNVLYFQARDGVHGAELWRSDGTPQGTTLVENIRAGAASSGPEELVDVAGTLYFTADDNIHGRDLWRSDGSESGTQIVKDIGTGGEYYGASALTAVGGTLFFTADDDVHGNELWHSDGTESGTVMVKDIRPGEYDAYPRSLTAVDGVLFFTARDGQHGRELWKSNGTDAGTTLVEDIDPTTSGYSPRGLTASGGTLYFSASDRIHGTELWRSDGTEDGTAMVLDLNTGGDLEVASRGRADTDKGTLRVGVGVDAAGTILLESVGEHLVRRVEREAPGAGTLSFLLEPTRAARRELRRNGELQVRVRVTFTTCGDAVSSVTRRYTLKLR